MGTTYLHIRDIISPYFSLLDFYYRYCIFIFCILLAFLYLYREFQINNRVASRNNFAPSLNEQKLIPVSVNYFFTRVCNYNCGFCFHTNTSSFVLPLKDSKRGLRMLKEAGMEKLNFSGGEPFITKRGKYLGELVKFCKTELNLESVTIVSNGSLITADWFEKYGDYLDIIAISCDSFNPSTNNIIGRYQNDRTDHIKQLYRIRDWCKEYNVVFKMNTVVNRYNFQEDMMPYLKELNPARWKVFQCLLIEGENTGPQALRNAEKFLITDQEFKSFLQRHADIKVLIPEDNATMKDSYLLVDENMCFLDCQNGGKKPSESILKVGVEEALKDAGFDEKAFLDRGGIFDWSKENILKNIQNANLVDW